MRRKNKRGFPTLTPAQQAVYSLLRDKGPMNDTVLVATYQASLVQSAAPQTTSGLRTRRSELVTKGYVVRHGRTKTYSGRTAKVWKAV